MAVVQGINAALRRVPTWPVYVLGMVPALWLVWLVLNAGLGVDPVKELEHRVGKIGLQFLIASLTVTPLRKLTGISLLRFRRAIGILAFVYVALHLLVWLLLDLQLRWSEIGADILKRPYITLGMFGFALLVPLVATSNNLAVRRMGAAAWQRLHKLTYVAALAGAGHYLWLVKSWPLEPILYFAGVVGLLALRLRLAPRRVSAGPVR